MAKNRFLGSAPAVAQVDTYTPAGTIEADDIFILTISGYDGTSLVVQAAAGGTNPTDVVTALKAAWDTAKAISDSLAEGMTATGTATLIITADTAGVGFKITQTTTEANGDAADAQTFSKVSTTANQGPNSWDDPNNWSEGTIPGDTAGEDTFVEDSDVDILYGLDQSGAAQTLASLHFARTYTGKVGHNGATGLVGDYLQLKATKAFIGEHFQLLRANGSTRIKLDFGSTDVDIIVYFMATSVDSPKPACRLLTASATSNIIEVRKGSVGLASETGESSTIGSVKVSFENDKLSDASMEIGSEVTITTLICEGGSTTLASSITTVTSSAGSLIISGTGTIGTLNVDGGSVEPVSSGLITTCNITAGLCDFTASAEARIVTTLKLDGPGVLEHDNSVVEITNDIEIFSSSGRQQLRATKT